MSKLLGVVATAAIAATALFGWRTARKSNNKIKAEPNKQPPDRGLHCLQRPDKCEERAWQQIVNGAQQEKETSLCLHVMEISENNKEILAQCGFRVRYTCQLDDVMQFKAYKYALKGCDRLPAIYGTAHHPDT